MDLFVAVLVLERQRSRLFSRLLLMCEQGKGQRVSSFITHCHNRETQSLASLKFRTTKALCADADADAML